MGKTPRIRKGKDRLTPLRPVHVARVGMKVWWQRTYYYEGVESTYWWLGIIEVRRGSMAIVRDRYNHEHVVGVGMLLEPDT